MLRCHGALLIYYFLSFNYIYGYMIYALFYWIYLYSVVYSLRMSPVLNILQCMLRTLNSHIFMLYMFITYISSHLLWVSFICILFTRFYQHPVRKLIWEYFFAVPRISEVTVYISLLMFNLWFIYLFIMFNSPCYVLYGVLY